MKKQMIEILLSAYLGISPAGNSLRDAHVSKQEQIEWVYKEEDGRIYRRRYNYTTGQWIGEWQCGLTSYTEEQKAEAEQWADARFSQYRDDTVLLVCPDGGYIGMEDSDIRENSEMIEDVCGQGQPEFLTVSQARQRDIRKYLQMHYD